MEIAVADEIVAAYLGRLEAAGAVLPPDRRAELLDEIREHIDRVRASGGAPDEASLRLLLDRLRDPDEIVGAAREGEPVGPPPPWWSESPAWARSPVGRPDDPVSGWRSLRSR